MPAEYLAKKLHDFVAGTRENAVMLNFAKPLSAQDVADVSAYYAGLETPAAPTKPGAKPPPA